MTSAAGVGAVRKNGSGASSVGMGMGMAVRVRSQGGAVAGGVVRGCGGGGVAWRQWPRAMAREEAAGEEEERSFF